MSLDATTRDALKAVSTATLTTLLLKRGLRNVWLRGPRPLQAGQERVVGPAFTLRFVPMREDLATPESWSSPRSTRAAIEAMPEGCIAVVDALGVTDAGIFGDILCARMHRRGVAALVTDGALRDVAGVGTTGLPVWCQGIAAPPSVAGLTFVGWQEPIACGGVALFPDDVVGPAPPVAFHGDALVAVQCPDFRRIDLSEHFLISDFTCLFDFQREFDGEIERLFEACQHVELAGAGYVDLLRRNGVAFRLLGRAEACHA